MKPDHLLQHAHQLLAAQGPAGRQHLVVEVLDANPGVLLQDVQLVEHLLDVHKFNIPGMLLRLSGYFERCSRRAVSAACVEEPKLDSLHSAHCCNLPNGLCYSRINCGKVVSNQLTSAFSEL